MFALLDKDPVEAIRTIFWAPLFDENLASYARPQILVKAAPLILIAIGFLSGSGPTSGTSEQRGSTSSVPSRAARPRWHSTLSMHGGYFP